MVAFVLSHRRTAQRLNDFHDATQSGSIRRLEVKPTRHILAWKQTSAGRVSVNAHVDHQSEVPS